MNGQSIRQFFRELLGSRMSAHLEEELLRSRADMEQRQLEFSQREAAFKEQIAQLVAKVERYEMVLLPMVYGKIGPRPEPPAFAPAEEVNPNSWREIQARWERDQEKADAEPKPS